MKEIIVGCILYILKFGMNAIYCLIKLFPIKNNKIILLSRQSNFINIDFELLVNEFKNTNKELEIKVLCKEIPQSLLKRIGYCFYMLKCMYHIATAKVCIIDGYSIPISSLKHKKKLIIIQIWHAMGAIKKFGKQVLDKNEGSNKITANVMKMHNNYSYVMCTSKATGEFYAEAFGTNKENILTLGMPRIDYLLGETLNEKAEKIVTNKPNIKDKKLIIYLPTFRKGKETHISEVVNSIDKEKYNLLIKLHPLDKTKLNEEYVVNDKVTSMELMKLADYIITDYSAVAFEGAVLEKPIFFYLYDIETYLKDRGLNIDLTKEMKSCTFNNMKQIMNIIENDSYNYEELRKFKEKYVETADTSNTKRIVDYIIKLMEV